MTRRRPDDSPTKSRCTSIAVPGRPDVHFHVHGEGKLTPESIDALQHIAKAALMLMELQDVERAYLEHLGAALHIGKMTGWGMEWHGHDVSGRPLMNHRFWLDQPRTLRRLADMPRWTALCSPPIETRDGPDPRVSCKACRGHGWDHRGRTPIACDVCRGQGVVVP